jgi:HK97 gp10 family phage protein
MIDLRISISKDDAKRLENATDKAIEAIGRVIEAFVIRIDREIKISIDRGPKSGRIYGKHQASAPGQPPATDSGGLVKSISWRTFNRGLSAETGSNIFYAPFLEDGTSKMDPRPWLRPAYEKYADDVVDEVTDVLKTFL